MSLLEVYKRFPQTIVKAKGSYLWDDEGNKYLDFYAGHAVCSMGHAFEPLVKAVQKQAEEFYFYSNIFHMKPAVDLAAKMVAAMQSPYKVYLTNSGSEANEAAIKMARKASGKKKMISFENSFHGRGITGIGVTGIDFYHKFEPNLDEYTNFAELGNMESVREAWEEDVAAVICEPIQSIGGVNMASYEFYKELADFCAEKGIYLIFDEVQTGCGRCGDYWFANIVGIEPDFITTAKGIASGLPLAAVMVKDGIEVNAGEHATTFGGGNIPCVAACAVFDKLGEPGFFEALNVRSQKIKDQLGAFGEGYLLGIEIECDDLVKKCLVEGLIIGGSAKKNIYRITPPLTVSDEEVDEFLEKFKKASSGMIIKVFIIRSLKAKFLL
ncbi:aspartate aminotransferase family protein [Candidatus Gracilibacteria bacterium]|nr:aspartate aminotransferase family protein [Candidatus Gracilibacteria bacterium]